MLTIDTKGLRRTEINGVEVSDFREIARIFSMNPKYENKSIYLIPDNYILDIGRGAGQGAFDIGRGAGQGAFDALSHVTEAKHKSGRKGKKVKQVDINLMRSALESTMPAEDLEEYIQFLENESKMGYGNDSRGGSTKPEKVTEERKKAIKSVYNVAIKGAIGHMQSSICRQIIFNDLDWECTATNDSNGGEKEIDRGELVPLPITNFTKEQIDDIRLGKTVFYIKRPISSTCKTGWKRVTIKGDMVDRLVEGGYNNDEVYTDDNELMERDEDNNEVVVAGPPIHIKYIPTGEEMVEITYIYGPNRSGKTYYAAKYATLWSEMFEDWPIFLFSRRDKDKVLDDIKAVNRVTIDESLVTAPLTMTDFEHSLVIFDDIDTIADKKICKAIQKLRDDIMETGRQKMIYVINTSHLGMNWTPTRTVLNEANSYTLFPRKGNYEHNFNILKSKMGMKPTVIKSIMDRPDGLAHQGKWGWVTVYKDSPQYIIYEQGVKLL
jgi:glycerol-3-phosphate cytidylyltransferase-like family protein